MAAIFGVIGEAGRGDVDALSGRLRHRGEHELIWSPAAGVWLGWRLPQVEPTGAGAPPVPLAFTGGITNRGELAELAAHDVVTPSADADAALLWALYERLGVEAFGRINGPFALALVERGSAGVVLAADRWATQPLYFVAVDGRCAFASECKALLALPWVPARPNRAAISTLQSSKYMPRGESLLADVYPVPPNGWVRLADGSAEGANYAGIRLALDHSRSEDAHADALRAVLVAAAGRLTEGAPKVGVGLSAGLDSAVTVGAVHKVAPDRPIHTYTGAFYPDDPDLPRAAEVARQFDTVHREIILSPDDLPRLLPSLVWHAEEPVAREEMVVYHALAQQAAVEVPLVLYGQMADMLFAGMPRHLLIKAANEYRLMRTPLSEFYDYTQIGAVPPSLMGKLLVGGYYRGRLTPPPKVLGVTASPPSKGFEAAGDEPLNRSLLSAFGGGPTEITAVERLHAVKGVRIASLFHDNDVVAYAFQIPDRLKIRGRSRKYILRRAAEGLIPAEFAARPKGLLRLARSKSLGDAIERMAQVLLAPAAVRERGLFEPESVERLRAQPVASRSRDDRFYHLWTLLLIEIWARTFLDNRGVAPITL